MNRNLFFGVLTRSDSFFAGSDLSSQGRPAGEKERRLLAPFADAVRSDILEGRWAPPSADGSGRDRDQARQALALLAAAGFVLDGSRLRRRDTGEPFAFEIMVNSRAQERLALTYADGLRRIGVEARVRLVDDVQYWRRLARFEFDMIQWTWSATASPGNEQRDRWASPGADREGSFNRGGVKSPAIDAMIDALLAATAREDFVAAVRALDRALLSGFYVVPLFYVGNSWLAYRADLRHPETVPLLGPTLDTWWRVR